ncbi:hypothetical protein D9615_009048 [Tricholomella constricta]|uniref:Macrofage activating glycoprotein n=1 Tax=Tricholomella constricta TaxID=117010 RepID=A0A8H5H0K5_9AGAR|nr:hypothetical protein D9615_009048 [Tricholomella constricta]
MSPSTRSFSALLALAVSLSTFSQSVSAQDPPMSTYPPTALADKHFAYPTGIPYKVDTDQGLIRGFQHGYNQCNSTTENQKSLCQTSFLNSIDDFCLWAPDLPESIVANTEGEMVAWCTKPGRGTRLIPANALKGVQFMRTPDYVQVVGFIDQSKINIQSADYGGEMDPHGADLRGNPMGGLMYSNAFSGGADNFQQVIEWHNFMGGNGFCLKACDPAGPNAAHFCEHRLDRIGCAYNAPNNAQNGTFEACKGDNQDFPGVYTAEGGAVVTYTQPPEEQGAISTMPYQPKVPASSECQQFTSAVLYKALASVTAAIDSTVTAAPTGGAHGSGTGKGAPVKTGTAAGAQNTTNDAQTIVAGGLVTVFGVVFSAMFFS